MKLSKLLVALLMLSASAFADNGAQEIPLWPAGAPGSEGVTAKELVEPLNKEHNYLKVWNVHQPSITVYLPPKEKATGAAVIICPDDGHRFLAMGHEGYNVAKWLSAQQDADKRARVKADKSFTGKASSGKAAREMGTRVQDEKLYGLKALYDGSGFARVPAGEFLMGSRNGGGDERPVHRVRISRSFEMGKFEVTQAQWEAVMGSNRDAHAEPEKESGAPGEPMVSDNPSHFKGSTLPVENVSWDDVQQFLRQLNRLDSNHRYRLPTEAEWEYACRAGSTKESAGSLDAVAWYTSNSGGQTQPVGQKQPNAWGLYDMHGNVLEWVQDWYAHDYYRNGPATDPQGPESGSYRVYRGGSWYGSAADCRPAFRSFDLPGNRYYSLGLRLVRTAK